MTDLLPTLLLGLICGTGAYYLTRLVRVLWPFRLLVERGLKPWVCNVCMSCWTSLLLAVLVADAVVVLDPMAHVRDVVLLLVRVGISAGVALRLLDTDRPVTSFEPPEE